MERRPRSPLSSPKVVVYDPTCPLCVATSRWLVARGLLGAEDRRSLLSFPAAERERLRAHGVRNEVLVLDPGTGESRSGVQGLLWLLGARPRLGLLRVLLLPPLRPLLSAGYRVVSYNRRIVAPVSPDRRAACACDPDPHPLWRTLFGAAALSVAGVSAASLGYLALPAIGAGEAWTGVLAGLLSTALAWGPVLVFARLTGAGDRGERAGHVAWLAATFGLWLLPIQAMLLGLSSLLEADGIGALLAGGLAGAAAVTFRRARRRAERLRWPAHAVPLATAWVTLGAAAGVLLVVG